MKNQATLELCIYQYLLEIDISDYYNNSNLIVANFHKVKGMQFDNVYILYEYKDLIDEEDLRALYVGVTRTKANLNIHTTNNIFNSNLRKNIKYTLNNKKHKEPNVINLLFGYKHINLGYFEFIHKNLNKLNSGDELTIKDNTLHKGDRKVALISKKGIDTIKDREQKG